MDLVEVAKASGDYEYNLFEYGLRGLKDTFTEDELQVYWPFLKTIYVRNPSKNFIVAESLITAASELGLNFKEMTPDFFEANLSESSTCF